jgi:hypothetical protein
MKEREKQEGDKEEYEMGKASMPEILIDGRATQSPVANVGTYL